MSRPETQTVIVGASVAGYRTMEALGRYGYKGRVVLMGDEAHRPYQRPPLSKKFLKGDLSIEELALERSVGEIAEVVLGRQAVGVDLERRTVLLDGGTSLGYSSLVIATGARPVSLGDSTLRLGGVFTLRSVDDALQLRSALVRRPSVVVVGAGFIGCEVGATCREMGLEVTIVEAGAGPLAALGPQVSEFVRDLHEAHGVHWILNRRVSRLLGDGEVSGVELDDGSIAYGEVVVIGLGVRPNTSWLEPSGLPVSNGIVCDGEGRVEGCPDVYAVGDVANWPQPVSGERCRLEHWDNAVLQADIVGAGIAGSGSVLASSPLMVPHFWSDQFGQKLQVVGQPMATDGFEILERASRLGPGERAAGVYVRDGRVTGALTLNWPSESNRLRREIYAQRTQGDVSAAGTADAGVHGHIEKIRQ